MNIKGWVLKTHSEAIAIELPYAFCRLRWRLEMLEVVWEVGDKDGGLRCGFWVILAPFLGEFVVTRHVVGGEVTPEEVGRVGIGG